LNHRGYLFAASTGTYTFTFTKVDENLFMWYGDAALSGWTKANAASIVYYSSSGYGTGTVTINAYAGQYIPIRIVWSNASTNGAFLISVSRPDGTVIFTSGGTGLGSGQLVRYSCDATTAPAFPYRFGAEV
jgi:hypothetical protein